MPTEKDTIDYGTVTGHQQAMWASGDFHEIARQVVPVSEALCQAVDPHAGDRVLDVACGSGNAALVAARRYCDVTGIVPPPPGLQPPVRWGTEEGIKELLGAGTSSLETKPQTTLQYFRSPAHAVEVFSTYFGPTQRAFSLVEPGQRDKLRTDLEGLFAKWNRAKDDTLVVESNYLRTIAVRK